MGNDSKAESKVPGHLIGIAGNFRYRMLASLKDPLIIRLNGQASSYMLIKLNGINPTRTLGHIRSIWDSMNIGQPFEYSFLSDEIMRDIQPLTLLPTSSVWLLFSKSSLQ
ncbi:MAG: hypothetical protein ACM3P0_09640 [Acidobacteriota bacterium]